MICILFNGLLILCICFLLSSSQRICENRCFDGAAIHHDSIAFLIWISLRIMIPNTIIIPNYLIEDSISYTILIRSQQKYNGENQLQNWLFQLTKTQSNQKCNKLNDSMFFLLFFEEFCFWSIYVNSFQGNLLHAQFRQTQFCFFYILIFQINEIISFIAFLLW